MFEESLNTSPSKIHQPTIDKMLPISSLSSPEKRMKRIISKNTYSASQHKLIKKRLKKRSQVILEKKIKQKLSTRFFDKEAELGSDNEEHDDIVKEVKYSDEEIDEEEDQENDINVNIDGLINDDIQEDTLQKEKFIEDEFKLDKERIRKVIDGPNDNQLKKKRKRKIEEESNDLPLQLRIERMNNNNEENNEEADFQSLLFNYKKIKNDLAENDNNEDLKELFHDFQSNTIKKLNKLSNEGVKEFRERIKEDNEILKNVIMKNKTSQNASAKQKQAHIPMKPFGSYMNKTNSFLHNFRLMKEEKEKEKLNPNSGESNIVREKFGLFSANYQINPDNFKIRNGCIYNLFIKR